MREGDRSKTAGASEMLQRWFPSWTCGNPKQCLIGRKPCCRMEDPIQPCPTNRCQAPLSRNPPAAEVSRYIELQRARTADDKAQDSTACLSTLRGLAVWSPP